MWITRDKDDNRLWIHLYSKPVLHTYISHTGEEIKRWVTESQFELDLSFFDEESLKKFDEVTFENSPKELIIKNY